MFTLLLIISILVLSVLSHENVDFYDIPKEYQDCPEVIQMRASNFDKYIYLA